MSFDPRVKKFHAAVEEFCGHEGINATTIATITEKFVGLLSARWQQICDAAMDEENNGKLSLGIPVQLDFTHRVPVGSVSLKFTPQRVNDGTTFQVEDPDQKQLPFQGDDKPHVVAGPPAE